MTPEERQQSLINARRAYEWLETAIAHRGDTMVSFAIGPQWRDELAALLAEFKRLDEKEQKQIRAGRKSGHLGAKHGKKGGRPKVAPAA